MALGLVLTVAVVGCKKHPQSVTPLPGSRTGNPVDVGPGGIINPGAESMVKPGEPVGIASNPAGSHQGWAENAAVFKSDTVYFAFDSSAVKASEKSKVAAVADYLKANFAEAVRIEGNCDERGTAEYNRALGERRALALREDLIKLGIDAGRTDTISYGFDRPVETGHNEAAWSKNRRGNFVLLSPPK